MKSFYFISLLLIFVSCSRVPKNASEYETWFKDEENGFLIKKQVANLYILVQNRPADLMALINLKNKTKITSGMIDSLVNDYKNSTYFIMEVGFTEEKQEKDLVTDRKAITYKDYNVLVNELSFDLESRVELVSGADTLKPILYNYERGYELGKKERFVFAFPKTENKNKQFIYYDDIFGLGISKFEFNNVKSYPKINLEIFNN